jgi:hypothetical protein
MLINYFLLLIMLLFISGLTLDAGLLEWKQIALQTAADAAAQEGMLCLARNNSTWSANGQTQAALNGFTNGVNGVTVTMANPPTSGSYSADSSAVQATISQSVHTVFMGLVNGGTATVAATAVAKVLPTCIWIMGQNSSNSESTLHIASASMGLGCGVYLNTSAGSNMGTDAYSVLFATRIRVQGSSIWNASQGTNVPIPRFGAAAKNDPLAYVTAPTFSSCMAISAAARSGAEFGAVDGNANNTAGMISVAQSAAPTITSLSVSAATWCTCTPNGTTVSCSSVCNTYDLPIQYVQVNAGATMPVMIPFPGIPQSIPLAGSSIIRAK